MRAPGSKSDTHRALVLAALARGRSVLRGVSEGDDTRVLLAALAKLGVPWKAEGRDVAITGVDELAPATGEIDLELAGTSLRFLLPLAASTPGGDLILTGNERMRQRPIGPLVEALRGMGAEIDYLERTGSPPVRVRGRGALRGGPVEMSTEVSSQFASALLLVAPRLTEGASLRLTGAPRSRSYLEMTVRSLRRFGCEVGREGDVIHAPSGRLEGTDYRVEGDASAASYFWGLAAGSSGSIRVDDLPRESDQGDLSFPDLLARMGCDVTRERTDRTVAVRVTGPHTLRPIEADMSSMPDTAVTLAVVAACAEGISTLRGLETLAHKESDRRRALRRELARLGIEARPEGEGALRITGGTPRSATVDSHGDHRLAMAFALLSGRIALSIRDPGAVSKSYPGFWPELEKLGVTIDAR